MHQNLISFENVKPKIFIFEYSVIFCLCRSVYISPSFLVGKVDRLYGLHSQKLFQNSFELNISQKYLNIQHLSCRDSVFPLYLWDLGTLRSISFILISLSLSHFSRFLFFSILFFLLPFSISFSFSFYRHLLSIQVGKWLTLFLSLSLFNPVVLSLYCRESVWFSKQLSSSVASLRLACT